jgi:Raf kinase inhibitor-like YbhB/YbcL family protein
VRRVPELLLLSAALAACSNASSRSDAPAESSVPAAITVTSPAFAEGSVIPEQFTCRGAGQSPPLAWSGLPSGASSVAVVVEDPDAPGGTFVHWVMYGLPADRADLPADAVPTDAVQARNSGGDVGWTPPCPPSGTHHYRFTVYALDRPVDLPEDASPAAAVRAVQDASIAEGTLTGMVSAS